MTKAIKRWRRWRKRLSRQPSNNVRRRNFIRSLALPFLPRMQGQQSVPLVDASFHVHPHYRAQTALDATLLKVDAGLDDFLSEKLHDQIATILARWNMSLLQSPTQLQAIENALAPGFRGFSAQPVESRVVKRSGAALEVHHITFSQPALDAAAFMQQLRSAFSVFATIQTAEFQVIQIDAHP